MVVAAAAARLGEKGFDVDEIVRSVFRPIYVGEFTRLCARIAFDQTTGIEVPEPLIPYGRQITNRVGEAGTDESFATYYLDRVASSPEVGQFGRLVAGWIESAEQRHLLRWVLPSESDLLSAGEAEVSTDACPSLWVVDRFLLTYVTDWHTTSLHEEFKFAEGEATSALDPDLLALRSVTSHKLHAEIAKRAVHGATPDSRALLSTGVEFLRIGDHERAVALFQGALAVSQSDWVRNCLAFCLVPSDAVAAADLFQSLLSANFFPPLVRANLAAICRVLGDVQGAHEHARAGLSLLGAEGQAAGVAYLWGFDGAQLVLMEDVNLYDYLRFVLGWR